MLILDVTCSGAMLNSAVHDVANGLPRDLSIDFVRDSSSWQEEVRSFKFVCCFCDRNSEVFAAAEEILCYLNNSSELVMGYPSQTRTLLARFPYLWKVMY